MMLTWGIINLLWLSYSFLAGERSVRAGDQQRATAIAEERFLLSD